MKRSVVSLSGTECLTTWLPEWGAVGPAEVVSVSACPPIRPGDGNVVTGTFAHSASNVINLHVDSLSTPIGCTANHPFWSEDRQAFIPAGDLAIGENLRTAAGDLLAVRSIHPRVGRETVYNLEVNAEHVYYVSSAGLLVHNAYPQKIVQQMQKQGLPSDGTKPYRPKITRNRRGDPVIEKAKIEVGPKRGKRGYVDEDGNIWIRDRAHSDVPDHWDVQIDGGNDYFRVDNDGNLL